MTALKEVTHEIWNYLIFPFLVSFDSYFQPSITILMKIYNKKIICVKSEVPADPFIINKRYMVKNNSLKSKNINNLDNKTKLSCTKYKMSLS